MLRMEERYEDMMVRSTSQLTLERKWGSVLYFVGFDPWVSYGTQV